LEKGRRAACAKLTTDAQRAEPCGASGLTLQISRTKWSNGNIICYARVFTDGQTLDAQRASLRAAGTERVFAEKVSGAVTDRRALARCMAPLEAGICS